MDGFAIRSADVPDGGTELRVVAPVPAGAAPAELAPGTAAPIMTGAMMPAGADAVVPIEQAVPRFRSPRPGSPATVRLPAVAGRELRPRRRQRHPRRGAGPRPPGPSSAPASWDCWPPWASPRCPSTAPLRVLLVTTGDEVVEPGSPLGPGKIYDSNATLLESSMRQAGLDVTRTGISTDRPGGTRRRCCAGMPRTWT